MVRYSVFALLCSIIGWACVVLLRSEQSDLFVNFPGLLIVIGGTLLTTILSQSYEKVYALIKQLPQMLKSSPIMGWADSEALLQIADWYRRGNLRIADRMVESLHEPILHYGAELIMDRNGREDIIRLLRWRIGTLHEKDIAEVQIVKTMATFAPAFGMLGTLFGLVRMLYSLGDSGLDEIGMTMGFAMTTTVYGLIAANILFKPLAIKLERQAKMRHAWLNVQFETILMIYDKKHPILIQEYLTAFLGDPPDEQSTAPQNRQAASPLSSRANTV